MHGSSDDIRAECRIGESVGGLGACSPRKFSDLKVLKRHFQLSQTDSRVKTKGSKTALSSAAIYFHN